MLRDELPRQQNQVVFSAINQAAHDELDLLTKQFLAKGGSILQVAIGASAYTQPKLNKHQHKLDGPIRERARFEIHRTTHKSSFGQNIFERGAPNKRYYIVKISNETFGTGEGWTVKQAKENRDRIRFNRGLPPAEY